MLADAPFDATAWPKAFDHICSEMNAFGAVALPLIGRLPDVPLTESLTPLVADYFQNSWYVRDERALTLPKLVKTGFSVDQDIFDPDEMRRGEYWVDFIGRHGLQWFGGARVDTGDDLWCLALQRTSAQGRFLEEEQKSILYLSARLSKAAKLANQIGNLRRESVVDALEMMAIPALIVDRQARVKRYNSRFQSVIGPELSVSRGEVVAAGRPDLTSAMRMHFQAAARPGLSGASRHEQGIAVPRAGRRPLFLQAHTLRRSQLDIFSVGEVLVVVSDPDAVNSPRREVMKAMFALTDSETKLVQLLAEGRSLTDAAHRANLTYSTARTYLKSIFSKTSANSQSDLVLIAHRLTRI